MLLANFSKLSGKLNLNPDVYYVNPERSGPNCSKLNEVDSYCDIKISILKYGKYIDIFC